MCDGCADAEDAGCGYGFGATEGSVGGCEECVCAVIVMDDPMEREAIMLGKKNNGPVARGRMAYGLDQNGCPASNRGGHAWAMRLEMNRFPLCKKV